MLATIPPKEEASSKERLEKLLLLAVNSSLRTTVDSLKTGEDEDEDMELVAKDVASSVRRSKISEERLSEAAIILDQGVKLDGDLIGGELKRVREYTQRLEEEGAKWAEVVRERTELVKNADRNAKAVSSGEITISDEIKWSLSGEERLRIKKISDTCSSAVSQLEATNSGASLEVCFLVPSFVCSGDLTLSIVQITSIFVLFVTNDLIHVYHVYLFMLITNYCHSKQVLLHDISTSCVRQKSYLKQDAERLSCAVKELTSRADTIGSKL